MNIVFRIFTLYWAIVAYIRRKILVKHIGKNDLVLDIGSGDKPFWRADVMVDKDLVDDQQRHSGSMVFDPRKLFIEADVTHLPFADKSFDFVYCSHLLEHVTNPGRAIEEIMRVGKKGYLEVPRAFLDSLYPFPPHLWFCETDGGVLIFKQKEEQKDFTLSSIEKFGKHFFNLPLLQYVFMKNITTSFICLYWQDTIQYKIYKAKGSPYTYTYKKESGQEKDFTTRLSYALYMCFYWFITFLWYRKKTIDKKKILR